jgi:subtilisin family serine protease
VPLKVINNDGNVASIKAVADALDWIIENHNIHKISVVNMSIGNCASYTDDTDLDQDPIGIKIRKLKDLSIPVVVAAGNCYFQYQAPGMSYPAIIREVVSVGAIYDGANQELSYDGGAKSYSTFGGQLTPFSQRFPENIHPGIRTDIFAPGIIMLSTGNTTDTGESIMSGTSQAAPIVAGVMLLLQEYHLKQKGTLPPVDTLKSWLRAGGITIQDGDNQKDNVKHTQKSYIRVNALNALSKARNELEGGVLVARPSPQAIQAIQKDLLMNGLNSRYFLK